MRRPDTFIIGAAKSGTTSLHQYLSGHPQVYMSPRKEPRYFAPDLLSGSERKRLRHGTDLDRYLAHFAEAGRELRVGEASPNYIYSREAPRLIRDFDPSAHILVMLRDPIDMMHSLHAHHVAGGTEPITDFASALAAYDERKRGVGWRADGNPLLTLYLDRGRFGQQLERWYEVFPRDRIHVVILEEMARHPAGEFRRVLEFLDVDPDYQPASFAVHNPRHMPRSTRTRKALTAGLPQRLRWEVLPRILGETRVRRLSGRVRQLNRRKAERTPLDPALRRDLQQQLAGDVALLSQLLGRDMAAFWWGRSARQPGPERVAAGETAA